MARRFYTSYTADDGALMEIYISDRKYFGTEISEFTLREHPKFPVGIEKLVLTRDVEVEIDILRSEENILEMIEEGDEDQFRVEFVRNGDYWWAGHVQHGSSIRYFRELSDVERHKGVIRANDMGYLNDILFTLDGKERGDRYEGIDSVANILGKCFAKLSEEMTLVMGSDLFYSAGGGGSWDGIESLEAQWLDQNLFRGDFRVFKCLEVIKYICNSYDMFVMWDGGRYVVAPIAYLYLSNDQVKLSEYRVSHTGVGRIGDTWFRESPVDDSLDRYARTFLEPGMTIETRPPNHLAEQSYRWTFEGGSPALFLNGDFQGDGTVIDWRDEDNHAHPIHWDADVGGYSTLGVDLDSDPTRYFTYLLPAVADYYEYINNEQEIPNISRSERLYQVSDGEVYPSGEDSYLKLLFSYRIYNKFGVWSTSLLGNNSINTWWLGEQYPEVSLNLTVESADGTTYYARRAQIFSAADIWEEGEQSVPVHPIEGEKDAILVPRGATLYFHTAKIKLTQPFRYDDAVLVGEVTAITERSQNPRAREAGIVASTEHPIIPAWVDHGYTNDVDLIRESFSYAVCLVWETTPTFDVTTPDGTVKPKTTGAYGEQEVLTQVAFPMTWEKRFELWELYAPLYASDGTEIAGRPRLGLNSPVNYVPYRGDPRGDIGLYINHADLVYSSGEDGSYDGETVVVMIDNDAVEEMKMEDANIGEGPTSLALSAIRSDERVFPEGRAANWYEARLGPDGEWDHGADYEKMKFIKQVVRRRLRAFKKPVREYSGTIRRRSSVPLTPLTRFQPVEWAEDFPDRWLLPNDVEYTSEYNTLEGTWWEFDYSQYTKDQDPTFEFLSPGGSVANQPHGSIRDVFGGTSGGDRTGDGDRTPRTGDTSDTGNRTADTGSKSATAEILSVGSTVKTIPADVEVSQIQATTDGTIQNNETLALVDAYDSTHRISVIVTGPYDPATGYLPVESFITDREFSIGSYFIRPSQPPDTLRSELGNMAFGNLYVDPEEPSGTFNDYDVWVQTGSGMNTVWVYQNGMWI